MTGCFVIWYPFVNAQNHAAANINHLYASTSTVVMIALIQNQLRNLRAALCPARKGCKVLIHIMIASTFIPLQTPSGEYVAIPYLLSDVQHHLAEKPACSSARITVFLIGYLFLSIPAVRIHLIRRPSVVVPGDRLTAGGSLRQSEAPVSVMCIACQSS